MRVWFRVTVYFKLCQRVRARVYAYVCGYARVCQTLDETNQPFTDFSKTIMELGINVVTSLHSQRNRPSMSVVCKYDAQTLAKIKLYKSILILQRNISFAGVNLSKPM